jgi:cell fate regulator YaaT (PSP1 superfamily)
MGCDSCSTTTDGLPKGCKNNGTCGVDSCNKLSTFDWLANMQLPSGQEKPFDILEVRFKNGRKGFFRNINNLSLYMGDDIAVEGSPGHDIGTISLTGELVKIQMKKKKVEQNSENVKKIYRKATQKDLDIWAKARTKEKEVQMQARQLALRLGLKMKISDVEFQGDGAKATFHYTADQRVDFRQLIKDMASKFSIRIEMRQEGARQEAQRLGGIGSCGRELCCSTWMTDFRSVSTSAARYQQLSLNPLKLAGQCGKLKCCLNYELDTYTDALKEFPRTDTPLKTEGGIAFYQKMDIFKGLLWYTIKDKQLVWYQLTKEQVKEIVALNKEGKKAPHLSTYVDDNIVTLDNTPNYENVVGQDSLTRFDKPKSKNNKRRNNNRNKNRNKKRPTNNTNGEKKQVNPNQNKPASKNTNRNRNNNNKNRSKNNSNNNQKKNNNNKSDK